MLRRLLIAALIIGLALWAWVLLPNSWFYKDRRPTRLGRATNRVMSWLASIGTPVQVTLEVARRRSSGVASTVLVPAQLNGDVYLVSMLGERSDWVRNVRAAGGQAAIRHGRRRPVQLIDVPVAERAPILKAYRRRAPGARPHFTIDKDAPVEAFERVAREYPVFRVVEGSTA